MEEKKYEMKKAAYVAARRNYFSALYERVVAMVYDVIRRICCILHIATGKELLHLLSIVTALEGLLLVYLLADENSALKEMSLVLIVAVSFYMGAWYKRDQY